MLLTTTDAAALLGVSRARVIALIHLGTLQAEKPGRDWQIDPASVEAYRLSPRKAGRKRRVNVATSGASACKSADPPQPNAEPEP